MKADEIKRRLDQAVIDYVERRIGVQDLSSRVGELISVENMEVLEKAGLGDLVGLIDMIADADYFLSQPFFNHHDPGNVLRVIDEYYEELQEKKGRKEGN